MARIIGTAGSAPAARKSKPKRRLPPSPQGPYSHQRAPRTSYPTPAQTRAAEAQRQGYVSQGRAVEHVANQQIRRHHRSLPVGQRRADRYRINAKPQSQWTPAERTIMRNHRRWTQNRKRTSSVTLGHQIAARELLRQATRERTSRLAEARRLHVSPDLLATSPTELHKLGFHKEGLADKLMKAPIGALVSGVAVADAAAHDPIGVPVKTAKQVLRAIPAVPGGVADLVTHPAKTLSQEAKQFGERSGQKFDQRVATIRKKGGLDYAGDALVVTGVGSATSAGAKELLGDAAKAALEKDGRIAVRVSGGTTRLPKARGAFGTTTRHVVLTRRAKKAEKRLQAAEAGGKPVDVLTRQVAEANRKAGHVVEAPAKFAGYKQRRLVAKQRGRSIYGFRADKGRRLKADTKAINRLNSKEKKALYYADVFGIRNAEQASHVLGKLHDLITTTRERDGIQVTGSLKKSDMLPDIEAMLKAPHEYFTEKLGHVVESMREDSAKAAREDPTLHQFVERRRRYAPLAQALGLEKGRLPDVPVKEGELPPMRDFNESDAAFVDRVAKHAKDLGLAEPLYFKSERYVGPADFAPHTIGGIRATARGRAYTGANLAAGLQDTRPSMYLLGKAQNIKRKHNWNLVANILEDNGVKELADSPGGSTVIALREHMAQAGVDMNSVALWNPGVYRKLAEDVNVPEHVSPADEFAQSEEFDHANITAALQHSIVRLRPDGSAVDGTGLPVKADALRESTGWQAVPARVLNELERQMAPSGKYARAWDIAKGKASRFMLLSGNVPWLGFQVVQNLGAAAAATGGRALNPANWVQAARWWKDLTPEQRADIGGKLGMDATGADSHQIRLGASTNSDMVNMYRAFKAHPFWHTGVAKGRGPSLSELNPFELMARADRSQNNVARIIAGYSLAKRDTVRRMGESMGRADRAQLKLTSILAKPPAEQLRAMADNKDLLEQHADAVVEWMGDYTSMTATERKVIGRATMFYPYLRYSLRLLFYTMPVQHPAVTAVLAELGQMRADELEKLFGKGELPFDLGKIYFGSNGHVKSIDLKRANPALNSLVDVASQHNLPGLIGLAPPWGQWIYDQMSQTSSYTGKAWKYNGHAAPYGNPQLPLFSGVRARILADDILGITFPYREAEKLTQSGPQGDDSTLFDPRPTVYKGQTTLSKLEHKFGARRARFADANKSLLHDLVPLIPQPDRGPAQAREDRIIERATPKPGHKARKAKPKYFGTGGSGSGYFGAGS